MAHEQGYYLIEHSWDMRCYKLVLAILHCQGFSIAKHSSDSNIRVLEIGSGRTSDHIRIQNRKAPVVKTMAQRGSFLGSSDYKADSHSHSWIWITGRTNKLLAHRSDLGMGTNVDVRS